MSKTIAHRRITEESHQQFAELSGDLNPLHVDAEAAAILPPGQRLAYGMDLLLWALETLAKAHRLPASLSRVRIRFPKWVFIDDVVELNTTHSSGSSYEMSVDGATVAAFDLYAEERQLSVKTGFSTGSLARRTAPAKLLFDELNGHTGLVPIAGLAATSSMFPSLAEQLGMQWVSECVTCSYIIGMEAPGLYSMSVKYDLQLCTSPGTSPCMHFKVVTADERFRKIRIAVNGAALTATLEALVREA